MLQTPSWDQMPRSAKTGHEPKQGAGNESLQGEADRTGVFRLGKANQGGSVLQEHITWGLIAERQLTRVTK